MWACQHSPLLFTVVLDALTEFINYSVTALQYLEMKDSVGHTC